MWKTAAILTLVFAGTASAQSNTTAREQVTICANVAEHGADAADRVMDGACIGTFFGWVTVLDSLPVLTPDRSKQFHIKRPGVSVDILIRAYCKYVKNHPEIANQPCFPVFILAMLDANLITQEPRTTNSGAQPSKPMPSVVEVHGGDTLKIIPGPEPQGTADFIPVPGSSVPLVYLGHNQKFLFACGETGESQFPTSYPKKEKGVTVCP